MSGNYPIFKVHTNGLHLRNEKLPVAHIHGVWMEKTDLTGIANPEYVL